ncbi:myoneurin [Aedes albopictus]|uniref:C2H2-type domain-containing protein n=1 Tax=Aedes albopictus TaxID=7160 RepID=A0ABM1ZBD2_AEDAL
MDKKKAKRRTKVHVPRCRLCREKCEQNKLLWNRDFREKLQDITCIWIKINPGSNKYNICQSCQNEVEVYYSFKKRCRQILHGPPVLSEIGNNEQSEFTLESLLENCSEEVTLPTDALETLDTISDVLDATDSLSRDHDYAEHAIETKEVVSRRSEQPKNSNTENDTKSKDVVKKRSKQPKNKPRKTLNQEDPEDPAHDEVSSDVPAEDDIDHVDNPSSSKKLRPYRRKFRLTEQEKSMTPEEYKRYYRKMFYGDYKKICDVCGKSIHSQRMESHMNRHQGVEPYACEECGLRFHCRMNLRKHITRSHAKGQEITCELCQKVCVSKMAHRQHFRAVHLEKKFQCTLCDVKAATQHALDRHMDIHNQRRDYVCPHCGKAFYRRYVLNIHLRTHSGETPYKCHVCGEAFVHRRIYVMHMKKHHPDEPMMRVDGLRALKEALKQKDSG